MLNSQGLTFPISDGRCSYFDVSHGQQIRVYAFSEDGKFSATKTYSVDDKRSLQLCLASTNIHCHSAFRWRR